MNLVDLIGNPTVFAQQSPGGQWMPVRRAMTQQDIENHIAGTHTYGTYVVWGDKARTLVFDLDDENAEANAEKVRDNLKHLGIPPECIGIEFSGRKGYHVWVVLGGYVKAKSLRRIGRAVLNLTGLKCEVFPKQDEQADLGSLIKLPGGVHRVTGKRNDWVGPPPVLLPQDVYKSVMESLPPEPEKVRGTGYDPFPCLSRVQEGMAESESCGRNRGLFQLAVLMRRAGMAEENLAVLLTNVNAKNEPPMPDHEVEKILESSANSGPICGQLEGSDAHCGEACIIKRVGGLTIKPGQLRHAAPGQNVVATVTNRVGKLVELDHPDLVQAKGMLS